MAKKDKKTNDLKLLNENRYTNIVTNLIYEKNPDRQVQMVAMYKTDHSVESIAKSYGCSESNIYKTLRKYREKPMFREKVDRFIDEVVGEMPKRYKQEKKLDLAKIAYIEAAALDEYKNNVSKAIDKPTLLKQMKQSAGVLEIDEQRQPVVNIRQINLMQRMVAESLGIAPEAIEAPEEEEIVDIESE